MPTWEEWAKRAVLVVDGLHVINTADALAEAEIIAAVMRIIEREHTINGAQMDVIREGEAVQRRLEASSTAGGWEVWARRAALAMEQLQDIQSDEPTEMEVGILRDLIIVIDREHAVSPGQMSQIREMERVLHRLQDQEEKDMPRGRKKGKKTEEAKPIEKPAEEPTAAPPELKPRTDRDNTMDVIANSVATTARDLTSRAIKSVEEHGQEAGYSISVKFEPEGGHPPMIKITKQGRLTVGTGKATGTFSLDDNQLRMDVPEGTGTGGDETTVVEAQALPATAGPDGAGDAEETPPPPPPPETGSEEPAQTA